MGGQRPRKSYPVETLRVKVNTMLSASKPEAISCRLTMASLLENVLMDTGNYKGFQYLASELTVNGTGLRPGADESRRRYF